MSAVVHTVASELIENIAWSGGGFIGGIAATIAHARRQGVDISNVGIFRLWPWRKRPIPPVH